MKNNRTLKPEFLYYVLNATSRLADTVMFTTYTVYCFSRVGMSPLQLVLAGTALESTALLFEVPTGVVADVYSRRLSVIIGMFILSAGYAVMGFAPLFTLILLGQVVSAIGYTFLSGATDAWLADEVGEKEVGRIYIRAGQFSRIAALFGLALSVGLASIALNLPFFFGGGLYLALGFFLIFMMGEHNFQPAPRYQRSTMQNMGSILRDGAGVVRASPVLLLLLVATVFYGAASEGFDRLGDAHLLANFTLPGLGILQPVVWFGLIGICQTLISMGFIEVLRKRMEKTSLNPGRTANVLLVLNLATMVAVFAFALVGNFPLAFVALMVKAAIGALKDPLYNAWLVQHTYPRTRATVLSIMAQSDAFGQIAGGPGIGWIGNAFSLRAAIAASGVLLAPLTLLFARFNKIESKEAEEALSNNPLIEPETSEA